MSRRTDRAGWNNLNLRLSPEMFQALDAWRAEQPGLSPPRSDVVREAIAEFLERRPVKPKRRPRSAASAEARS